MSITPLQLRAMKPRGTTRKAARAKSTSREAPILRAVLEYLRYHPAVARAWRQNSGAAKLGDRFIRFTDEVGLPDICGFMKDGRALYVEVKAPKGRPAYWQQQFLDAAAKAGCVAGVARSLDDAAALLSAHLPTGNQHASQ